MEVSYLFAGIGMIILIGFLGTLLFERTKIPDILILIFIGLFIGPILSTYTNFGLLGDPEIVEMLQFFAPHFAALALVIILFDGGLNLNLEKTVRKMGLAIILAGICFVSLMVVTALICVYVLNMNPIVGLLLGAVIGGGPSGPVVIPLLLRSSAKEDTRILLTLESVLTDVVCIVVVLIFIEIIRGSTLDTGALIQKLLSSFVLAGFIAFLFGVFWLMVLKKMEGKPFAFMVTIAALFVLYAMTEFIQVSGAIAALVFGLVLSNKDEIARILKFKGSFVLDEHIKQFHSEVSFLVRTFFFVYLGLTFTFAIGNDAFNGLADFVPTWISESPLMILGFIMSLIFGGLLLTRFISTTVICAVHKESKPDKPFIFAMMGRGLAAGVVATLPFTIPAFFETSLVDGVLTSSSYHQIMAPHQNLFLNIAFMIIVLSVTVTSIGMAVIERRREKAGITGLDEKGGDWVAKSPTYRKALESKPTVQPAKPQTKEGPKPWSGPPAHEAPRKAPPARHEPVQTPKKATPAQLPRQNVQPKTVVQAQPVRKTQTSKPAPLPVKQTQPSRPVSQPVKRHTPAPPKDHPLVKRAAESEKALPKKKNAK
jgi:cell volume regulation protein A